jgi:hypothetical protein
MTSSQPGVERPAAPARPHGTPPAHAATTGRAGRHGHAPNPDLPRADRRYGPGSCRPRSRPAFRVEIVTVGGEEGRRLDEVQAAAIREVLEWLHAERPSRRAPAPPPTAG